jgi:hypothetical protein
MEHNHLSLEQATKIGHQLLQERSCNQQQLLTNQSTQISSPDPDPVPDPDPDAVQYDELLEQTESLLRHRTIRQ